MDLALRPMSISQVLDRTFYLYKRHFVLFAGIAIITPAMKLISLLVQLKIFGPLSMPAQPENITPQFMQQLVLRGVISIVVGMMVYVIGTTLASSATAYAVSMVHLGKTTTILDSYKRVMPILWRILRLLISVLFMAVGPLVLIYTLFLVIALVMLQALRGNATPDVGTGIFALAGLLIGMPLFFASIVWMFFAICRYALSVPACTLEDFSAWKAMKRSTFLTNGRKWGILGILVLTGIMTFAVTYALQLPALLASNMVIMSAKSHLSTGAAVWIYVADFLGGAVAGPVTTIALVLVYFDQRIRKEAFDLQLMMEAIGQQPQPQAATAAPTALG